MLQKTFKALEPTKPGSCKHSTSSLPRCCRANVRKSQFCFHLTFDPLQVANNLYLKNLEPMDMFYYCIHLDWKDANLLSCMQEDLTGSFSNCSNAWKQLQITEDASCNLPSAGGHCWDKARRVACLMCLGSAQHPHISRPSISFCLSGWARPNQNEIRESGWQMLRERERAQDENAPCKYLQPKNYLLDRHKVSKNVGLHTGQQAKAKATSLTNSESLARLICYSCFSGLMRLRQTLLQKTHLLSACFEECLHSNACSLLQWDGSPSSCSLRAAKSCLSCHWSKLESNLECPQDGCQTSLDQ